MESPDRSAPSNPPVILVFADWFLPGYKAGGPIRSIANLVDTLTDYKFYIITRSTDLHSSTPYAEVEHGKWVKYSNHVSVFYCSEKQVNRTFVRSVLREIRPTHIYLNSLFSPRFTLIPLLVWRQSGRPCSLVIATRGMLKEGALSIKSRKKKLFLKLVRGFGLFAQVRWHATNAKEAEEIRDNFGASSHVIVAPNLPSRRGVRGHQVEKRPGDLKLISIARISPEKGILDGLRFLSAASLNGRLSLMCFGAQQNQPYLQECIREAGKINNATILFPGEISPDNIAAELDSSHFLYAPTWGENYGHSIAESLLHGVPVIISDRTPWRNLEEKGAGWDVPLDPDSFGSALRKAMDMDHAEYVELSSRAARYGAFVLNDPEAEQANRELFS